MERLLVNGTDDTICDDIAPFVGLDDPPIFAQLMDDDDVWLQWVPTIMMEDNGPSINDKDRLTSNVLHDGGGRTVIETGEKTLCVSV